MQEFFNYLFDTFLYHNKLSSKEELIKKGIEEFNLDEETSKSIVNEFFESLRLIYPTKQGTLKAKIENIEKDIIFLKEEETNLPFTINKNENFNIISLKKIFDKKTKIAEKDLSRIELECLSWIGVSRKKEDVIKEYGEKTLKSLIEKGYVREYEDGTVGTTGKSMKATKKDEIYVDDYPNCDFCNKIAYYKGETILKTSAYMCESCFNKFGIGFGDGKGFRLIKKENKIKISQYYTGPPGMPTTTPPPTPPPSPTPPPTYGLGPSPISPRTITPEIPEETPPMTPTPPHAIDLTKKFTPIDLSKIEDLKRQLDNAIKTGNIDRLRAIAKQLEDIIQKYTIEKIPGPLSRESFIARLYQTNLALRRDLIPLLKLASEPLFEIFKNLPVYIKSVSLSSVETEDYSKKPSSGRVDWIIHLKRLGSNMPEKCGIIRVEVIDDKRIEVLPYIFDVFGRSYPLDSDGIDKFFGYKFETDLKNLEKRYLEEEEKIKKNFDKKLKR